MKLLFVNVGTPTKYSMSGEGGTSIIQAGNILTDMLLNADDRRYGAAGPVRAR